MHGVDSLHSLVVPPAVEKRIAKELSPPVAWPTLFFAVVLPTASRIVTGLGLFGFLPLWACALILTPMAYAHYTLVHESIHDNLVPGHPKLRSLNTFVGWIGALGLGFNWPMMMRTHVLHHAHTNTDDDPDIVVKGTFLQLVSTWARRHLLASMIPLVAFKYLAPAKFREAAAPLRGTEVWQASAVAAIVIVLLVVAIATGHTLDWLCLLYIPTRLAALLLAIFFQWLPHHPFDRSERYLNTRISLWPGGLILTLQQNLHLMHHLWPSVPFYNYARLYRRLHPTLVAKGSRIEGLMVGRYAVGHEV